MSFTTSISTSAPSPLTFPIEAPSGLVTAPSYSFLAYPTTGIWLLGADSIDFTSAGVNRLSIQTSAHIFRNSMIFGANDNEHDFGKDNIGGISRCRNAFVGTDLYLGGTPAGTNTSTSKIYFGSANTATTKIESDATQIIFTTPSAHVFRIGGVTNKLTLGANYATFSTNVAFQDDNERDFGNYNALLNGAADRGRPKNVYVGSDLYLGGTVGGSDTSTSKLYFGSQTTSKVNIATADVTGAVKSLALNTEAVVAGAPAAADASLEVTINGVKYKLHLTVV